MFSTTKTTLLQIANKYMKRWAASPIVREMQIKIKNEILFYSYKDGYYLKFFLEQIIPSVGKNMDRLEFWCIADESIKWCSHCGKQYGSS